MKETERIVTIGEHRGNPRLWLEGLWLVAAGFKRGGFYRVSHVMPHRMVIVADADGDRTISGKTKNGKDVAIIDINDASVIPFQPGRVLARITKGKIVLTPEI